MLGQGPLRAALKGTNACTRPRPLVLSVSAASGASAHPPSGAKQAPSGQSTAAPKPVRKPSNNGGKAAPGGPSRGPAGGATIDPVEKARRKMGYKNNWNRHDVDESKQITWTKPLRQDPTVAIIGGGLSGLMCATGLVRRGIRCVAWCFV